MTWKVVAITDTHNKHNTLDGKLPEGDVIVHAGDATNRGSLEELVAFFDWFACLPYTHKVYVPGNHDHHVNEFLVRMLCRDRDIIYLQNEGHYLQMEGRRDLFIYGTPAHRNFLDADADIQDFQNEIPDGLDVLITHVPPYGIHDEICENFKQIYLGNYHLLQAVFDKKPKFHVFGHVHPGYGKARRCDTTFINACICDNYLNPINIPVLIEID